MVSVIRSVPLEDGLNRHVPTSASRMSSLACSAVMFLKLGCLIGRLMSWRALDALLFSFRAFSRSSRVRMWYHLQGQPGPITNASTTVELDAVAVGAVQAVHDDIPEHNYIALLQKNQSNCIPYVSLLQFVVISPQRERQEGPEWTNQTHADDQPA